MEEVGLMKGLFAFAMEAKIRKIRKVITSLIAKVCAHRALFNPPKTPKMPPTTSPLEFDHKPGFEIPTKHKEAIRQLH
jgi:hypothetical protein